MAGKGYGCNEMDMIAMAEARYIGSEIKRKGRKEITRTFVCGTGGGEG